MPNQFTRTSPQQTRSPYKSTGTYGETCVMDFGLNFLCCSIQLT